MSENKRFTTVELPKPNKWGIWYDGAYLSTYQVCILLNEYADVKKENQQLKQQKGFLKIHDDYYIQVGDDGELFDLHKPADIRSLCSILNREHGFSELECEYNDVELEE